MKIIKRSTRGFIKKLTRSLDCWLILAIVLMLIISLILISSSGSVIAKRISLSNNYFIYRQIIYLSISIATILLFSLTNYKSLWKISLIGTIICIILLIFVLFCSTEIKGAKRWIYLLGISIQPSEFIKPFFAVTTAWILSSNYTYKYYYSLGTYLVITTLLLLQPDFSMSIILSIIWIGQLFILGIPYIWFLAIGIILTISGISLCYFVPYIKQRIYVFLDPHHHDSFQIDKSIKAFKMGKLTGIGPGEGNIKLSLPDCHTDFIFAVAAEEFGAIFCLVILLIFGFIITRIWNIIYSECQLFNLLSLSGLLIQFTIQFLVNIGVVLNLLPTTGIALPLLSYGGSSLISTSILLGMILSFSKNRLLTKRIIHYNT